VRVPTSRCQIHALKKCACVGKRRTEPHVVVFWVLLYLQKEKKKKKKKRRKKRKSVWVVHVLRV